MRLIPLKWHPVVTAIGYAPLVVALGQQPIISFSDSAGAFQVAGGPIAQPQILVSSNEFWGVIRAAGDLAKDFGRVTGINFTLSNGEAEAEPAAYEYRPITRNYTHVSYPVRSYTTTYVKSTLHQNEFKAW